MQQKVAPVTNPTTDELERSGFYKLLVSSIQDYAIFLMDSTGHIRSWNIGAQRLKGYAPEEIIGKHFSTFYPQVDIDNGKPEWELRVCNEQGRIEDEGWRVKKDGSMFWANVVITALHDKSGKLVGYAKVTRDLTERKKHEDALREANRLLIKQRAELEILNASKDEFISLASHQLRTPASGVKQFLGLLLEGYAGKLSDQQTEFLKRAYEGNDRQIDLVNDLLRVAKVDAGKVTLQKTLVEIKSLLEEIIDEQADAFKDRHQGVSVTVAPGIHKIRADKMRFRMVLENLVDNASKYTPDGGSITITARETAHDLLISVTDTGVGIEAQELPKLFEKFSRIHNVLSDTVGGSGLGLYWADKITGLHGGDISVTSEFGEGSTFTVRLPRSTSRG